MPDYSVRFAVNLIPFLKPEGWANPIYHDTAFRVKNYDDLQTQINKYIFTIMRQQGFITIADTNKPLEDNIETMDLRVFVPMHMVSYFTHKTIKLANDIPDENDETIVFQ